MPAVPKITVDGVPTGNARFSPCRELVTDPDLYKTTEVSVGNNSVTLGNNAIGGGVALPRWMHRTLLLPDQKWGKG